MSIKFRVFAKNCNFCNSTLTNWDYRYKEKHYCRSCYEKYFIFLSKINLSKILTMQLKMGQNVKVQK